ncbi:MAG: signal peptidase II [Candidatus Sericytochromatia bacterium]
MSSPAAVTRKRLVFVAIALAIFVLDQVSKYPIRAGWQLGQSRPVFPWLSFTYVQNTGSLFGIFQGNPLPLGIVSALVSGAIIWYAWHLQRNSGWLAYITLGTLLGGAVGNMLDRLFFGFVVDFFDLQANGRNIWPVFNVADIAVDVAIGLFVLMAFLEPKTQPGPEQSSPEQTGPEQTNRDQSEAIEDAQQP